MNPNPMIPGEWITAFVVSVIGAIAGPFVAYKKGKSAQVKLPDPMPEMPVRKVYTPPTFSQHQDLVRRVSQLETETRQHREYVETQLRDIRREQSEQFVKLMNAGESRKDAIMESMNEMVRGFHERVDLLLMDHKPRTSNNPS